MKNQVGLHKMSNKISQINSKLYTTLLPLNRRGRFRADVINDAVDTCDFVDDAGGDAAEQVGGQLAPVGGHEIGGVDTTDGDRVFVGATATRNTDALHG